MKKLYCLSVLLLLAACGRPAEQPESTEATLSWMAPLVDTEGECIEGLSAYRIDYWSQDGAEANSLEVSAGDVQCEATAAEHACGTVRQCSHTVAGLTPGTWGFRVRAVDTEGRESEASGEVVAELD